MLITKREIVKQAHRTDGLEDEEREGGVPKHKLIELHLMRGNK